MPTKKLGELCFTLQLLLSCSACGHHFSYVPWQANKGKGYQIPILLSCHRKFLCWGYWPGVSLGLPASLPLHQCPSSLDSWCFYKRSEAAGENIPSHTDNVCQPLTLDVAEKMVPVSTHMSHANLLWRFTNGNTQKANECLHPVVWSRCSKTVFMEHTKLQGAMATAVASFNEGAKHLSQVMEQLRIETNKVTSTYLDSVDQLHVKRWNELEQTPRSWKGTSQRSVSASWMRQPKEPPICQEGLIINCNISGWILVENNINQAAGLIDLLHKSHNAQSHIPQCIIL